MRATDTPGVIANAGRKNGATRDVRRMAGLESAARILGGQDALAAALGTDTRMLRKKMAAERPIHDEDVRAAARAVSAKARAADDLAARLSALLPPAIKAGQ